MSCGKTQLNLDKIQAGTERFRDGVLNLQSRVDFEEVELRIGAVNEELECAKG